MGPAGLDGAAALFRYDDLVQRFVLAAKNGGRRDLLRRLGLMLAEPARSLDGPGPSGAGGIGFDAVTWVPASRPGRRRRGYDQGRILAGVVALELGLRSHRLLRATSSGMVARGRAPGRLLLVDDVITTGASMAAAAEALRAAGARSIAGVAVAWAVSPTVAAHGAQNVAGTG